MQLVQAKVYLQDKQNKSHEQLEEVTFKEKGGKRQHKRVDTRLDVFSPETEEHIGRILNLSINGMFIRTNAVLSPGTKIPLEFNVPGELRTIKLTGTVKWVENTKFWKGSQSGMGIQFINIDEGYRNNVSDFLDSYFRKLETQEPNFIRPLDIIFSSFGIIFLSPVWLLIAFLIKLEDGGSVFFRQLRWGKGKKKINVLKFRTMVENADKKWKYMDGDGYASRITRIGNFLRSSGLDESPQLINIWKGDMSFVGPRALPINVRVNEDDTNLPDDQIPGFDLRSMVRPGLTGVMQLYAPSKYISRRNKFKYDLICIRNQSTWFYLKIVLITCYHIVTGKNWDE